MKLKKRYTRFVINGLIIIIIGLLLSTLAIGTLNSKVEIDTDSFEKIGSFYATVEFTLYEGEGCACDELQDILIFADGQDNDHDVGAYTNDRGYCYLELEIDATYRISIQDENYQNVLFDILIVDDQEFTFHLNKDEVSVPQEITIQRAIINQPQLISK